MANNLLDILNQRDDLTEEELLQYLQGNLTPEERNAVEQRLVSSDMMSDAEEGLRLADEKKMRHCHGRTLHVAAPAHCHPSFDIHRLLSLMYTSC